MIAKKSLIAKLQLTIIIIVGLISIGTLGYMIIDNFTFLDALFLTIIAISTVGFDTVNPLSDSGKIFTIILIISSLGIVSYVVSIITNILAEGDILKKLKIRAMNKEIRKLENHVILCGFGRNGRQAAKKLRLYKKPFIIIESDMAIVKNDSEFSETIVLEGNATHDKILKQARIEKAIALITALPSDADNLFVVLSARQLNQKLQIISRASQHTSVKKLKIAGANNIIMPDKLGGEHMASLIVTPDIVEFLDQLSIEGAHSVNLVEISMDNLSQELVGKTIKDVDIRSKTGCTIIGVKTPEKEFIVNPDPDLILEQKTQLILLGQPQQISRLSNIYNIDVM